MWQLQAVIIASAPAPMATDVFTHSQKYTTFSSFYTVEKGKGLELQRKRGIYKDKCLSKWLEETVFVLWSENLRGNGLLSDNN